MLALPNLADFRMQQQIAHEIYRQQIMQRLPDPFPTMLPFPMAQAHFVPPQPTLPGVEAKLENNELWQQFHKIGTEMIITKSGRRMFPSMRVSLSGLEEESNYCVLLEMVPIGDCRYKFSGSQWVPAGGAEPQSPQRMYLHPDSPATGAHWQTQPLLFNKVKLTNNTLDNSGQVVLASMHKYQPRIHVIRTAELSQIPWAPQQAFVFPETEFVAVTAYQNDRITKLKIDNNPFAKGFRESGQSRCKRKLSASPDIEHNGGGGGDNEYANESASCHSSPQAKRLRSSPPASLPDDVNANYTPEFGLMPKNLYLNAMEANMRNAFVPHFYAASATHAFPQLQLPSAVSPQQQQQQQQIDYARHIAAATTAATYPNWSHASTSSTSSSSASSTLDECESQTSVSEPDCADDFVDVVSTTSTVTVPVAAEIQASTAAIVVAPKRSSFSILDILGNSNASSH